MVMDNNEYIFRKVERIACECASVATSGTVLDTSIYSGKTKTSLGISIARQLAFLFMHDHYGISYRRISKRAQMTVNAVMKCVGKARQYRFTDPIYRSVYEMINNRL